MRIFHKHDGRQPVHARAPRIATPGAGRDVPFGARLSRAAGGSQGPRPMRDDRSGKLIGVFGRPEDERQVVEAPATAPHDELPGEPVRGERSPGFSVLTRDPAGSRPGLPPADLPLCAGCLAEISDPANRRFRYPFTNCADCGPRFTIATATPYERANTTMSAFRMCPECRREYGCVGGRRFHAEPAACPACGPQLTATTASGHRLETDDVIETAARAVLGGAVVAIKGTGGFYLACDATSEAAVTLLRQRKQGDQRPFAVMVQDVEAARQVAALGPEDEALLVSAERPIVIVNRREPSPIARCVAPSNPLVGLFLPGSALQHLFVARVGRPLVMTAGRLADEPVAYTDEEALGRLARLADLLVLHNREIVTRCEDSVARVIDGQAVVLRRSRGYVPRSLTLRRPVARPVLACGALLNNTFCLARGDQACIGPHMGDLGDPDTFNAYRESIDRFERLLHFEPAVIAHDLNPDCLSSRYAAVRRSAASIAVQHHHAHVASVMAEHGVEGPVIGVAYDDTGLGTDGAWWGGEIMLVRYAGFQRLATLRPIALAGGDTAVRQPWRIALALADDAFGGEAPIESLQLFRDVPVRDLEVVRAMIRERVNAPLAHGAGRYVDAMAALGSARPAAAYDGQLALEWTAAAAADDRGRYRYDIQRAASPWQIDLRAAVRDAVFELVGGEPSSRVSARFHNTLVAATADLVRGVARAHGHLPVALSGGCFQNPRLTEGIVHELEPEFTVLRHAKVPPGDGGVSLGQAVVADAVARTL